MIIKAPIDGQEQEFEIVGNDGSNTHVLNNYQIRLWNKNGAGDAVAGEFLRLRLIRATHTFGGVVFEETGEVGYPNHNDWYLHDGKVQNHALYQYLRQEPILRPIAIE